MYILKFNMYIFIEVIERLRVLVYIFDVIIEKLCIVI